MDSQHNHQCLQKRKKTPLTHGLSAQSSMSTKEEKDTVNTWIISTTINVYKSILSNERVSTGIKGPESSERKTIGDLVGLKYRRV